LTRIESKAFSCCSSAKSIVIPRHVYILCSGCFSYCKSLSSISFETESELARIEADIFYNTSLSSFICLTNASFIAGGAFRCNRFVNGWRRRYIVE
jgi:hypothetical protein